MAERSQTMELRIELAADANTVHGSLQEKDGYRLSFWGWLELMEALQQLVRPHNDDTDRTPDRVPDPEGRLLR
jgi:hypothetical protein